MTDITLTASHDQNCASDPDISAWVSANAGSGKTHVLVNRVIRLMLSGVPPEKILCLTYTRAAAAQMSTRLFERLAEWIPLDDDALIDIIHKKTGHVRFSSQELAEPRRLFAKALETPGGLKVQTIHAFCEQLLHRFPVEAGITPGFEVLEDRQASELLADEKAKVLNSISQSGDKTKSAKLAVIVRNCGGIDGFNKLLRNIQSKRAELGMILSSSQVRQNARLRLCEYLKVGEDQTAGDIIAELAGNFARKPFADACELLVLEKTKTNKGQAEIIRQLLNAETTDAWYELYRQLLLTGAGKAKAASSLCTNKFADANPAIRELMLDQQQILLAAMEKQNALIVRDATDALLEIGGEIITNYEASKLAMGRHDYLDLILRTLAMFENGIDAAWVLYKLDGGIDHILVDEAQDTSPEQWKIIKYLADDFFSGEGARGTTNRTVFAVGDRKQSIYRFQGASPDEFDNMQAHFSSITDNFRTVPFRVSFRSVAPVLFGVDNVFKNPGAASGVGECVHSAVRSNSPGLVEMWDVVEVAKPEKSNIWQPGGREDETLHARDMLARKIAAKISTWLSSGETIIDDDDKKQRLLRPDDFLILVRSRTTFMDAMVRALKMANIPVAGADRLKLNQHIAVQDLLALIRFVLLPQDDLNFASLLKSPLLARDDARAIDDSDLMGMATDRGDKSLWQAFDAAVSCATAKKDLLNWIDKAGYQRPYEFLSGILVGDGRRARIVERLGSEALEPIDALLSLALDYEDRRTPTLQGFADWVSASNIEIKRDMDQGAGEVRIMTVHGAKGLEAKIVIMPDTCSPPDKGKISSLMLSDDDQPVWRLGSRFTTNYTERLKADAYERELEEYHRLLYVAMTRASDRLYICGFKGKNKLSDECWYALVEGVLKQPDYEVVGKDETVWRMQTEPVDSKTELQQQPDKTAGDAALPDWLFTTPPKMRKPTPWHAPSQLGFIDRQLPPEQIIAPGKTGGVSPFARGNHIHKLLQYLPEVKRKDQNRAMIAYLERFAFDLPENEKDQIVSEVTKLINDEQFAQVFSSSSRAEVSVTGTVRLDDGKSFSFTGQIDRLCVSDDKVLIIDYKTNRPPPDNTEDIPLAYIRQLAAYSHAMVDIYPGYQVHAALLWTNSARLMPIPASQLHEAFLS